MEERSLHALLGWALLLSMLAACVLLLCGVVAPYGRYSEVRALGMGWGVPLGAKTAWMVQELPALLVPIGLWATNPGSAASQSPANRLLLVLFCAHYVNRAVVFPLRLRGGKPTPFGVFLLSFVFCLANGYLQGRHLTKFHAYPSSWLASPQLVCGVVVMVAGWGINYHSDHVLRNLRKPGETGYKIPRGGVFEFVSGANFFGEIVEWSGFALACGGAFAPVAFALSTAFNIGPRAVQHHAWYLEKFKDEYPKQRKALIPFVF